MQQKNSGESFMETMQSSWKEMMTGMPASPFDIKTMMETGRKNMQAMAEANKRAVQGWQTLAQRQSEMVSQFIQDNSTLAGSAAEQVTTEQKMASAAEAIQSVYKRSIANTQELAQLAAECTKEAAEVINQRIVASMNEIRSSAEKDAE